jgi:hypothetical protein
MAAGGPCGSSGLIAGAATEGKPVRYLQQHKVMSEDRAQARVVALRLLATDCGCLESFTTPDLNKILKRLEPLFGE